MIKSILFGLTLSLVAQNANAATPLEDVCQEDVSYTEDDGIYHPDLLAVEVTRAGRVKYKKIKMDYSFYLAGLEFELMEELTGSGDEVDPEGLVFDELFSVYGERTFPMKKRERMYRKLTKEFGLPVMDDQRSGRTAWVVGSLYMPEAIVYLSHDVYGISYNCWYAQEPE